MRLLKRVRPARSVGALALSVATGCASKWVELSPLPPTHYVKLGPVEGHGCATAPLALPWHQIYAFGASDRLERARADALARAPSATGLINVSLQEEWSYWLLFSRRCAIVRGDAIR